ncbi:MAG: hypothetical protein ABI425_01550 [Patescibacteria group bacterium]
MFQRISIKFIIFLSIFTVAVIIANHFFSRLKKQSNPEVLSLSTSVIFTPTSVPVLDCFDSVVSIKESGVKGFYSSLWWVNSGGMVDGVNGICKTVQGSLPTNDKWRLLYSKNNPKDTDDGYHPQNMLRLVNLKLYKDFYQQVSFKINKINLSASDNRNQSNGVLLFNRYQDGNNLYYLGVRVDGHAIIKKKQNGIYFTLAEKQIFPGKYDRNTNPNLLPLNTWLRIKSELVNTTDSTVRIRFYLDTTSSGEWSQVFEYLDSKNSVTGIPILNAGYGGIRSDFMDIEFKDFEIKASTF